MQEVVVDELPELTCQSSNKARMLCTSSSCTFNSFICMREDCEPCENNHLSCQTYRLHAILTQLSQKRQVANPQVLQAGKKIIEYLDQSIERICLDKDLISDQMELYGLNEHEATLYRMFKEQRLSEVTGKITSSGIQNISEKIQMSLTEEMVVRSWNKKKKEFQKIFDGFKLLLRKKFIKFQSKVTDQIFIIEGFFERPIYQFNLLYRASDQNYQTSIFHSKCDGKQNTLVLAKTQYGKIVGAFTPLKWNSSGQYANDIGSTEKTFLFSISLNEKYLVMNQANTVYCNGTYGPTFGGGHDFYIANMSSTAVNTSYFNFPHSFNLNGKYIAGQQAKTAFSGSPSNQYARVMEWEVYQLQFV